MMTLNKIKHLFSLVLLLWLTACAPFVSRNPAPVDIDSVKVLDGESLYRFTTQDINEELVEAEMLRLHQQRIASGLTTSGMEKLNNNNLLALSGGGSGGAFGAGLLYGWTEAGTRPEFYMVTGVSTGSLAAPFIFLGSDYDEAMREVFTNSASKDIFQRKSLLNLFFGDSATDNEPLRELIEKHFNEEFINKIADEHLRGRRLIIGTTNLDKKRPAFWDMGAIANSQHPDAMRLFQDVILASTSIPVMFPPVYIPVNVSGETYDEMHVDGGVSSQVFIYPLQFKAKRFREKHGINVKDSIYVIRNTKLLPNAEPVTPVSSEIASTSLKILTDSQGLGDIALIYSLAVRDKQDFSLAYIPQTFTTEATEAFDPVQMSELFNLGRESAAKGYNWEKEVIKLWTMDTAN